MHSGYNHPQRSQKYLSASAPLLPSATSLHNSSAPTKRHCRSSPTKQSHIHYNKGTLLAPSVSLHYMPYAIFALARIMTVACMTICLPDWNGVNSWVYFRVVREETSFLSNFFFFLINTELWILENAKAPRSNIFPLLTCSPFEVQSYWAARGYYRTAPLSGFHLKGDSHLMSFYAVSWSSIFFLLQKKCDHYKHSKVR